MIPQGVSAELIANKWKLSRQQLDEFSAESHQRAARAWKDGLFDSQASFVNDLRVDETIRPESTVETLSGLRLAFKYDHWMQRYSDIDWRVTAGNNSPINDGAAALLVTSEEAAHKLGLKPRARVHTLTVAADDPVFMLTGIIPATQKVLAPPDGRCRVLTPPAGSPTRDRLTTKSLSWILSQPTVGRSPTAATTTCGRGSAGTCPGPLPSASAPTGYATPR